MGLDACRPNNTQILSFLGIVTITVECLLVFFFFFWFVIPVACAVAVDLLYKHLKTYLDGHH